MSYEVGFKKPPKAHQWKPGQSGNPTGRPKGETKMSGLKSGASSAAIAAAAAAPRQATREDNRRILDALDKHYDVDACMYRASHTDASVAASLDMPRAWVAAMRDLSYGPDINEASAKMPAELEDMIARMTKLRDESMTVAERADALLREGQALLDRCKKAVKP